MTERDIIEKARKRVKEKKDFYGHLSSYIITIGFLFFINLFTSPDYFWFVWPALGWGIGLAIHFIGVFSVFGDRDSDWEEKELQKEIRRLKRKKSMLPEESDILDLDDERLDLEELKKERAADPNWDDKDFV